MIIALSGKARAGKDEAANYLVNQYDFKKIAFADALKRGCMEMFRLSKDQVYGDKKEVPDEFWGCTPRYLLQFVGTNLMRNHFDPQIWCKVVAKVIQESSHEDWVISDCRFPNEAKMTKHLGGHVIRLNRNGAGAGEHTSEVALDNYEFDFVVDNNGSISDLHEEIDSILLEIYQG